MKRVAVVGLGLVGGSVALGLKRAQPDLRVVGVDVAEVVAGSEARRVADELFAIDALERALTGVDLAVLAAPVRVIARTVVAALERAPLVTDCGSTKRVIAEAAAGSPRRGRFVPGHPMAGGPEGGAGRARADLFRDRRWLLCPEASDADAVAEVEALVRRLGALPVRISAEGHDRAVALTSHAPQLMAAALRARARERGAEPAAGPAFEAATRAASENLEMWRDIFLTNADAIAEALELLTVDLSEARAGLGGDPPDAEPALALMARAKS